MKRVGMILLSSVIVISLLFSSTAYAQTEREWQLPSPGITPDSPFYFLDLWGEKIGLFFAFGAEAKARKALEYAEERLAEAYLMAVRNRSKAVRVATNGYDEYVAIVIGKIEEARNKGVDISEVSELVGEATLKHLEVLEWLRDEIVPVEAVPGIQTAIDASQTGYENALLALAGENPGRAMEINLAAIEGRLNRARANAEDNDIAAMEAALTEFQALNEFGETISEIAQELGQDTTTLEQRVAEAADFHLTVLAAVLAKLKGLENVPDEARLAIVRAMENSVRGHQRAVEALQEAGALGDIPEEPPVPEGIPGEVKDRLLELGVLENNNNDDAGPPDDEEEEE